uniref:Uncharacterized protein n=1 Tax=Romanomermis culicivorax TaxID=13658 RepID=A0A915ILT1_ROMCU
MRFSAALAEFVGKIYLWREMKNLAPDENFDFPALTTVYEIQSPALFETQNLANRIKTTLSANCRRPENYDRCVDFACEKIRQFHNAICTSKLRQWVGDKARNCFLPQYEQCFRERPPNNLIENEAPTPSICRNDASSCLPYACDKMHTDYGRSCNDQPFQNQVWNKLKNCNSPSVDLCLVNLHYELLGR